eukprot:TRINITY_DN487_c0_g1_i7.p1 TRINITY_DN487_c0_g1~~TRINITY_DN487_c0_g1_i7.p1  ORF type:complete len:151 (-),score=22.54 TRINITY_DN487_c0_g1_i7:327-779(-)
MRSYKIRVGMVLLLRLTRTHILSAQTPDVKLLVPFAIKLSTTSSEQQQRDEVSHHSSSSEDSDDDQWFVVNWIESKASFGDEGSHMGNVQDQLWGYRNRYGPGIVVYWFGFIHDLREKWKSKGILLLHHFPPPGATIELLRSSVAVQKER